MELDKRQWHVRWFFWSLMVLDEFRKSDTMWRYERGTNLCHFIRVMLVWAPLVLLVNVAVYVSAIAVLTALPIYLYGAVSYAWIVGVIAFVVGLILATKFVSRQARQWEYSRSRTRQADEEPKALKVASAAPTGPGFFEVLWKYIVATKKKVCPTITFNRQTQEAV